MRLFDRADALDAMQDILDRERAAILQGRFDVLERLTHEKARALQAVLQSEPAPERLRHLQQESRRNGALLEAARAGIEAAQARLSGPGPDAPALRTYDSAGRQSTHGAATPPRGHRA